MLQSVNKTDHISQDNTKSKFVSMTEMQRSMLIMKTVLSASRAVVLCQQ